MKCPDCGFSNPVGATKCTQCGRAFPTDGSAPKPAAKSPAQIAVVVFFLLFAAFSLYGAIVGYPLWVWLVLLVVFVVAALVLRGIQKK